MLILKCSSRLSVVKEAEVDIGQLCMVGGTINVLLGGLSLSEISHVDSSNNRLTSPATAVEQLFASCREIFFRANRCRSGISVQPRELMKFMISRIHRDRFVYRERCPMKGAGLTRRNWRANV